MAITPHIRVDKQDREKFVKALQINLGATQRRSVDTQDLEKMLIELETAAAITPVHKKINNEDMEKVIREIEGESV